MLRSLKSQRTKLYHKIKEEIVVSKGLLNLTIPTEGSLEDLKTDSEVSLSVLTKFEARFECLCEQILAQSEGRSEEELDEESQFVVDVEADLTRTTAQLSSLISRLAIGDTVNREPLNSSHGLASLQHKIDKLIELQGLQSSNPDLSDSALAEPYAPRTGHVTRLPKLEFDKFSGDVLKFQEFWDSFDAAVHSNPSLRPVEKLNYLRAYLLGDAKHVISGVSTCDANYDVAIELIRKRFGDPQASIDTHYSRLTNLPSVPNQTNRLRSLMDEIEKHLRCLCALGEDIGHRHFISLIMSKLPREVVVRLEEAKEDSDAWTVELLRKKFQSQLSARESAERQHSGIHPVEDRNSNRASRWTGNQVNSPRQWRAKPDSVSTVEGLVVSDRNSSKPTNVRCSLCNRAHFSDQCQSYKSVKERRQRLRGRCFICLGNGHQAPQCQVKKPCYYCKQVGRHNRCLCPSKFSTTGEASTVSVEDSSGGTQGSGRDQASPDGAISQHTVLASGDRVLLQTALVKVKNPSTSASLTTRVLLDSASNRSYISVSLAKRLKLQMSQGESFSVVTFGSDKPKTVKTSIGQIQVFQKNDQSTVMDVNVVPKITGMIHRSPVQLPTSSFLFKDLPLADSLPVDTESSPVDFLIGSDYYLDVMTSEKMKIGGGLYLLGSQFGWILTGRIENSSRNADPDVTMFVNSFVNQSVPHVSAFTATDSCLPIKPSFEDFWRLESIGIKDSPEVSSDDKAILQFNSEIKKIDGRYHVRWPWKNQFPDLPDNYQMALGRLQSLLRKFQSNTGLFKKYADIITDQESKGIVEKLSPTSEIGMHTHYIPHHPVVSPTKATTKIRIVYDASAKVRKGSKSLNECLLRGPVILENLCGLLLRFRTFPIAVVSDIEKAFLQVGLQVPDRDVTRFLWLKDSSSPTADDNLQVYRFCRVPFGIISSPFLLGATVRHHLLQDGSTTAKKILADLYVDNAVSGVASLKEALKLYKDSKIIFGTASMNIRQWASNCSSFTDTLPAEDKVKDDIVKVLGVNWDTASDTISVSTTSTNTIMSAVSKRQMLQSLASVFDPLGLFTPLTLRAKLFIHSLWKENIDWDVPINSTSLAEWIKIGQELSKIYNHQVPRFGGLQNSTCDSTQLLCFCDASSVAYSTVVYAKVSSPDDCRVTLVFAKSRLAPTKTISIPRMELLALLIGVRCLNFVEQQLRLPIEKKILWTDSQCVLYWLNSTKPLTVFVENRLREIKKTRNISFRFISGRENPADVATRGQYDYDDVNKSAWWSGPPWAATKEDWWPVWPYDIPSPVNIAEIPSSSNSADTGLVSTTYCHAVTPYGIVIDGYSSLIRLYRVTAWISRFIWNARKKSRLSGMLDAAELGAAKLEWDRHVQRKEFQDVLSAIMKGSKCNLKEQLNVKADKDDILRCYGRFFHSNLPNDSKFPKLLPRNDHYTNLVIRHFHTRLLHSGVNHTLSQIRMEYWIPQGRSAVWRYISGCITCRRVDGGPYSVPHMPPLPATRVSRSSSFGYVGLDYLGLLFVKLKSQDRQKVWLCLFTCMAVRAIHLELVEDLSAEQFLLSLRRFIARRGKPIQIISDNASQFKMSVNCIDRLWSHVLSHVDVQSYVGSEGISWKFIVERAPWMGGFYERLIGSVKRSMKRAIGKLCLNIAQLTTVITEIEAVLNSRPLTYTGDDSEQRFSITPSDFICLNPKNGIPSYFNDYEDPSYNPDPDTTDTLLNTWKRGQKVLDMFWQVWHKDYLAALRERSTTVHKQGRIVTHSIPQVGDVVLVKEDNVPRGSWKLGRIHSFLESGDGEVRAAQIRFGSGSILNRPLKLLYPLEHSGSNIKRNYNNSNNNNDKSSKVNSDSNKEQVNCKKELPKRRTAVKAMDSIKNMLECGQL